MSEILKKETCSKECYPRCPVYNILQRRIGKWRITNQGTIEGMIRHIQKERCPDGAIIDTNHLRPANTDKTNTDNCH